MRTNETTTSDRFQEAARRIRASQADVVRHTGASKSVVHRWFTDPEVDISARMALSAADFFGVSVRWLILGEGAMLPGAATGEEKRPESPLVREEPASSFHQQLTRLAADPGVLSGLTEAEAAQMCVDLLKLANRANRS